MARNLTNRLVSSDDEEFVYHLSEIHPEGTEPCELLDEISWVGFFHAENLEKLVEEVIPQLPEHRVFLASRAEDESILLGFHPELSEEQNKLLDTLREEE